MTRKISPGGLRLLTPLEVAQLFHVNPRTVTRWAKTGKLPCIRTIGGHRRYEAAVINQYLNGGQS